jgi:hypothetical protein
MIRYGHSNARETGGSDAGAGLPAWPDVAYGSGRLGRRHRSLGLRLLKLV